MRKKLLFLYIEKYGSINRVGFNLSSDIEVILSKNGNKSHLTIRRLENAIPELFHPDIVDIKGIVGENGSGKSTLIRFLAFKANRHPEYFISEPPKGSDIVALMDFDEFNNPVIKIYAGKNWHLNHNNISLVSLPIEHEVHEIDEMNWDDIYGFRTSIIYYSNIFDNKNEDSYNDLFNISTNFLAKDDLVKFTNNPINPANVQQFVAHKLREDTRRVSFAIDFRGKLPFKLPEEVFVYFNGGHEGLISKAVEELKIKPDKTHKGLVVETEKWLEKNKSSQGFTLREKLHKEYLNYLILNQLVTGGDNILTSTFPKYNAYRLQVLGLFNKFYVEGKGITDFGLFLDGLKDLEIEVNDGVAIGLGDSKISRFIENLNSLDRELSFLFDNQTLFSTGFRMPISEKTRSILNFYKTSLITTDYLSFSFPTLSSGELGFLTLFSRFYSLVDPFQIVNPDLSQDLLILIDEGDLYFHPKWQVLFLKYLNEVMPLIFPERNIQFIISSHSPFIASDLPKNNLLLLRKGNEGEKLTFSEESALDKCVIQPNTTETLGANIHELLSDSFFLEGAHIGELAKNLIYRILDQLEGVDVPNPLRPEHMYNVIDQIGEPWVKSRLLEKYDSFYKQ